MNKKFVIWMILILLVSAVYVVGQEDITYSLSSKGRSELQAFTPTPKEKLTPQEKLDRLLDPGRTAAPQKLYQLIDNHPDLYIDQGMFVRIVERYGYDQRMMKVYEERLTTGDVWGYRNDMLESINDVWESRNDVWEYRNDVAQKAAREYLQVTAASKATPEKYSEILKRYCESNQNIVCKISVEGKPNVVMNQQGDALELLSSDGNVVQTMPLNNFNQMDVTIKKQDAKTKITIRPPKNSDGSITLGDTFLLGHKKLDITLDSKGRITEFGSAAGTFGGPIINSKKSGYFKSSGGGTIKINYNDKHSTYAVSFEPCCGAGLHYNAKTADGDIRGEILRGEKVWFHSSGGPFDTVVQVDQGKQKVGDYEKQPTIFVDAKDKKKYAVYTGEQSLFFPGLIRPTLTIIGVNMRSADYNYFVNGIQTNINNDYFLTTNTDGKKVREAFLTFSRANFAGVVHHSKGEFGFGKFQAIMFANGDTKKRTDGKGFSKGYYMDYRLGKAVDLKGREQGEASVPQVRAGYIQTARGNLPTAPLVRVGNERYFKFGEIDVNGKKIVVLSQDDGQKKLSFLYKNGVHPQAQEYPSLITVNKNGIPFNGDKGTDLANANTIGGVVYGQGRYLFFRNKPVNNENKVEFIRGKVLAGEEEVTADDLTKIGPGAILVAGINTHLDLINAGFIVKDNNNIVMGKQTSAKKDRAERTAAAKGKKPIVDQNKLNLAIERSSQSYKGKSLIEALTSSRRLFYDPQSSIEDKIGAIRALATVNVNDVEEDSEFYLMLYRDAENQGLSEEVLKVMPESVLRELSSKPHEYLMDWFEQGILTNKLNKVSKASPTTTRKSVQQQPTVRPLTKEEKDAVKTLQNLANSNNAQAVQTKRSKINKLINTLNNDAIKILELMTNDGDESVRTHALTVLMTINHAAALNAIKQKLKDPSSFVRKSATFALGHSDYADKDPDVAGLLGSALNDDSSGVRNDAISGLWELKNKGGREILKKALSSKNPDVKFEAARKLSTEGETKTADVLMPYLKSKDKYKRFQSAEGLSYLPTAQAQSAVDQLRENLKTSMNDGTTKRTIQALARIKTPSATAGLIAATKETQLGTDAQRLALAKLVESSRLSTMTQTQAGQIASIIKGRQEYYRGLLKQNGQLRAQGRSSPLQDTTSSTEMKELEQMNRVITAKLHNAQASRKSTSLLNNPALNTYPAPPMVLDGVTYENLYYVFNPQTHRFNLYNPKTKEYHYLYEPRKSGQAQPKKISVSKVERSGDNKIKIIFTDPNKPAQELTLRSQSTVTPTPAQPTIQRGNPPTSEETKTIIKELNNYGDSDLQLDRTYVVNEQLAQAIRSAVRGGREDEVRAIVYIRLLRNDNVQVYKPSQWTTMRYDYWIRTARNNRNLQEELLRVIPSSTIRDLLLGKNRAGINLNDQEKTMLQNELNKRS